MASSDGPEFTPEDGVNGIEASSDESEVVKSKPEEIPPDLDPENIPAPPPDMPPDWGAGAFSLSESSLGEEGYSGEEEREEVAGENGASENPEFRGALLQDIRVGTLLRHVEIEVRHPLKTQDGEFKDIRSELTSTLMSKRISQMHKSRDRLTEMSPEINSLKEAVIAASRDGHRFSGLHALLKEVNEFEKSLKEENITQDMLSSQCDWPVSLICTLGNIVAEVAGFKQNISVCLEQERSIKVNNQPVSYTHLISSLSKLCLSATCINNESGAFESMIAYFRIDRDELGDMVQQARLVSIVLLAELVEKSFLLYAMALEQGLQKIELIIRVKNSYFTLHQILKLCKNLEQFLGVPKHTKFSELSLNTSDLRDLHLKLQTQGPSGKPGPAHMRDVELQDARKNPPPVSLKPKRLSYLQERNKGVTDEIVDAIERGRREDLGGLLEKSIQANIYTLCEQSLVYEVVRCGDLQILDVVLTHRERILKAESTVLRKDFTWMLEAFNQRQIEILSTLINHHKMPIDTGPLHKEGNTLFYSAVRKFDYEMMIHLLELGANPLVLSEGNITPLHYLAIKKFALGSVAEVNKVEFGCLDFAAYVSNPNLSDVVLVSSEGKKFFAHRLLLCSQSPVFKSMLESGIWGQSGNNEQTLPTIRSQVLSLMLTYLYTGDLLYPHDDLTLGVELLACAQQFLIERMQGEMEHVLSRKIDNGVVIELYQAALSYGANFLLNSCCRHLLMNYAEIADPNHACLLHLFSTRKGDNDSRF